MCAARPTGDRCITWRSDIDAERFLALLVERISALGQAAG